MLSSSLIGWRPGVGGVGAWGRGGGALATLHAPVEKKTLVFLCVFFFCALEGLRSIPPRHDSVHADGLVRLNRTKPSRWCPSVKMVARPLFGAQESISVGAASRAIVRARHSCPFTFAHETADPDRQKERNHALALCRSVFGCHHRRRVDCRCTCIFKGVREGVAECGRLLCL